MLDPITLHLIGRELDAPPPPRRTDVAGDALRCAEQLEAGWRSDHLVVTVEGQAAIATLLRRCAATTREVHE